MRSASVQYRYLSPFPTFQVDNKGAGLTKEQEARLKTVIESQIMPGQQEACEQFRSDIMMKVFKGAGCAENKRSEWPEKIQRLWNLYHQGAVGDKDLANEFAEVDLAILKEAIIKIFHQLLGPKWYFKDEASSDNVYYAMGYTFKCFGDVTIPQSTQFEETDGFVTTDGKVKIFKSSYAAFRCSFSYRAPAVPQNTLESFLASGFTQPSVVKVLFQGTENESAWMDVDPSKIMAIGFSYNALEESSFQYNGSNGSFATPLDLDKGPNCIHLYMRNKI